MIEEFSGGYYRIEMTVQPLSSGPSIERGLYNFIDKKFYCQTSAPVTMRVGLTQSSHFQPSSEGAMPTDVLGLPENLLQEMDVHPSAENVSVLILKPAHAYMFGQSMALGSEFLDNSNISDTTLEEEDKSFFNLDTS